MSQEPAPSEPGEGVARNAGARFAAGLIILAYLVVNLVNLDHYGMSLDEQAGMFRGKGTSEIVSAFFRGATYELPAAEAWYHPAFYAWLNYEAATWLVRCSVSPVAAGHVLNVLTASLGLGILFQYARRQFDERVGLFAVVLFALFPRFIAHSHFNGKDVPVMVFSMAALYMFYEAVLSRRMVLWLAAGLAFAMSVTTKLDGLILLPIMAVVLGFSAARAGAQPVPWRGLALFGLAALFAVFLLWPVLWHDPWFPLRALRFFSGDFVSVHVPYLGRAYAVRDVPWHYTMAHLVVVTPVLTLALGAVGAVELGRRVRTGRAVLETSLQRSSGAAARG